MIPLRAACHVHSDWSYDGKWSLERIAAAFSRRGYRVVMLTEHDRGFDEARRLQHRDACLRASSERILLVPGIEYSDRANCVHILTWGDVPFAGENAATEEVLAAVHESGGAAVFAHPSRQEAWKQFNPDWHARLVGIECWNRKTDGWAPSRDAWRLLQVGNLMAFGGLDFHTSRQFFPLATVLQVEGPLTEAAVLASLRSRRCPCTAFKLPIEGYAGGLRARSLAVAEFWRRRAAMLYRHFSKAFRAGAL